MTIERYGILKQWVQTLDSSTPVIEFAVEKDFMPGFYLSVLVMSPRVAAPPPEQGELDLGKPSFKLGYLEVPVTDPYKQIRVDVEANRAVYKPGDKVRVRVNAQPREREQREPIEIAVAVLDEAVLDLDSRRHCVLRSVCGLLHAGWPRRPQLQLADAARRAGRRST